MKVKLMNPYDVEHVELPIAGWMASVSTDSDSDYEKIAKFCLDSHHHTPTRATRFIFEISEVSRAFSHEFVRHEIGLGKVQRSQRYVNEDGFQYVTPAGIASVLVPIQVPIFDVNGNFEKNVMTWLDFDEYQKIAQQMYKRYVEEGIKAEDARYALTNATFTKIHVSFDYEGLKNFCAKRLCSRAQWEIRSVAEQVVEEVRKVNPYWASKLVCQCDDLLYCNEKQSCGKRPKRAEVESLIENANKIPR